MRRGPQGRGAFRPLEGGRKGEEVVQMAQMVWGRGPGEERGLS